MTEPCYVACGMRHAPTTVSFGKFTEFSISKYLLGPTTAAPAIYNKYTQPQEVVFQMRLPRKILLYQLLLPELK